MALFNRIGASALGSLALWRGRPLLRVVGRQVGKRKLPGQSGSSVARYAVESAAPRAGSGNPVRESWYGFKRFRGPAWHLERGYGRRSTRSRRCANGRRTRTTRGRECVVRRTAGRCVRGPLSPRTRGLQAIPPSPRRARSGRRVGFRPARQLTRPDSPSGTDPAIVEDSGGWWRGRRRPIAAGGRVVGRQGRGGERGQLALGQGDCAEPVYWREHGRVRAVGRASAGTRCEPSSIPGTIACRRLAWW